MKKTSGQASSELMLVVSVVVIAVTAAAFEFVPTFRQGVQALATEVSTILASNAIGGANPGINQGSPQGWGVPPSGGANSGAAQDGSSGGATPDGLNLGGAPHQWPGASAGAVPPSAGR